MEVNLNCDLGEKSEHYSGINDQALIEIINTANIACGYHAGSESVIETTIKMAKENSVSIGAHPGFADKENFGRFEMDMDENELLDTVRDQIQLLVDIASEHGVELSHVKPHGALYNRAVHDEGVAETIGEAIIQVDPSYKVMGLAGSKMLAVFDSLGLDTMAEAFADRTYESDGTLRNRKYDDALITDPKKAGLQTAQMMGGYVVAVDGVEIDIQAQTLCIHSDTPNAVAIAKAVRKTIL